MKKYSPIISNYSEPHALNSYSNCISFSDIIAIYSDIYFIKSLYRSKTKYAIISLLLFYKEVLYEI